MSKKLGGNMVSEKEKIAEVSVTAKRDGNGAVYNVFSRFGEYIFSVLMTIFCGIKNGFMLFIEKNGDRIAAIGKAFLDWLKKIGTAIISPITRRRKATKYGLSEISRIREEKGFFNAFIAAIKKFFRMLFGKRGLAYSLFNYALPIVCTVLLFNIVTYANSMTYALRLTVNGEFVGYVSSETVFTEAERIVQQRINYMDNSTETVTFEPTYQLEAASYGDELTKYQLADKLLASMDAEIEYAYGMYIDNSFYGAVIDNSSIEATLESLLESYRTGVESETVEFENKITYEYGLYLSESIVDPDSIIQIITSKKSTAAYYTAVEGDSPLAIADKLGLSIDEIAALNPGFSETSMVYVGDKYLIDQEEPYLAVAVTRTEVYMENTQYQTEYYDDSTKYLGSRTTIQDGEYGRDRVTANVSYINGVEVRRKVLERIVVEEPVTKIVAVGTKPHPTGESISIQDVEVGQMYWPVGGSGGLISEMPDGYGGYPGHKGVDIAADYGAPIIAAENGTVIMSQWYGGYGNCIMVQHDDGIITVYGHCSYLHVGVGERVTQGQQIADVGSTGDSTGNHLHFEVRINGICMYPLNYLPWHERASWCVEW